MWSPIFDECPDARSVVPHLETSGCCLQNAKPCFFQEEVLCFLSRIKIKKCWQLWLRLLRSDTFLAALRFDITNTHTHTQRYKTHSGASRLTHPKIYTYATCYELTAAIFITMNE